MELVRNRNEVIAYTVSKAINSELYISIQNGEVMVKAPWYYTKQQIQQMVEQKKNWIINKLKEYENLSAKKRTFIKTKVVKILGANYYLKVSYKNIKMPTLNVENRDIQVTLPNKYKKIENSDILKMLIDKMYNKIAETEIELIMEKIRIELGIAPEDYTIARMKDCLGRCNLDKTITINPDIVMYEKETIEFVILHEFCHLQYKTHAKGFIKMMEEQMPNYEQQADKLGKIQY